MKINLLLTIIFILQVFISVPVFSNSNQEMEQTKEIALILWRTTTNAERGFVEYFKRQNRPVHFTYYETNSNKQKLKEIVNQIKSKKTDLIYCFGTTSALALSAHQNTSEETKISDIPVVFCIVSAPLLSGVVKDLNRPGKNITGVTHLVPFPDQLKAIQQVFDGKKIGFFYNPMEGNSIVARDFFRVHAEKKEFILLEKPIPLTNDSKPDSTKIETTLTQLVAEKPDFVYLPSDSFLVANRQAITKFLKENKIPTFSATEVPIRTGDALMGLVCQYYSCGLFAGYKAEQILFEAKKPGDIPVEPLKKYSFLVNMDTALSIDFFPPITVLQFAEIIKTKERGKNNE